MQKNLPELLRLKEGEQLDFKQRISSKEKIAKTICAFANTRGGWLLIGVKDDRTVSGIDPEEEKFMLHQAVHEYCQPQVPLFFEELEDDEQRTVLLVEVPESLHKPHACLTQGGHWQVYVRQRDKSIPADKLLSRRIARGLDQPASPETALTKYESAVKQYIELHEKITCKQLMVLLNFSRRRAQRMLIDMVEKGLIRQYNQKHEDYFA